MKAHGLEFAVMMIDVTASTSPYLLIDVDITSHSLLSSVTSFNTSITCIFTNRKWIMNTSN